jgi:hypothetical protein
MLRRGMLAAFARERTLLPSRVTQSGVTQPFRIGGLTVAGVDMSNAQWVEMPPHMPWAHVGSANNYVVIGLTGGGDDGSIRRVDITVTAEQAQAYARAITEAVSQLS